MLYELSLAVVATIIATALIAQFVKLRQVGGLRKFRIFEVQAEGEFNEPFYEYFEERLREARDEIVVTGEGFEFKGQKGPAIAKSYHAATVFALAREVEVVRFQTLRPLNPMWAECLKELLEKYGDRFSLYVIDNEPSQDIASVCVIDPFRRKNIVEIMLSSERFLGDSNTRVASTAVFIHGRKDLAEVMKNNIMALKKQPRTHSVKTVEQLDALLERNS